MSGPVRGGNEATEVVTAADLPRITGPAPGAPSTEAVGEVRRSLDLDAIRRFAERVAYSERHQPGGENLATYHIAAAHVPALLAEVERLRILIRSVELYGTGYRWRRSDGEVLMLHPADVDVFLAADQVTELERLRTELEASALAAERLFEQRDTAIAEATKLRERIVALKQTIDAFPDANAAANLAHARAQRDQAIADLKAFGGEVKRLYEAERRADAILGVIAHRHRYNPDAMAMEPGDAQRALAAIFEAVDAYATKEASDG